MNTPIPSSAGAPRGAGVFVALAVLFLVAASCATPRAGASPPRTSQAIRATEASDGPDLRIRIARSITETRITGAALRLAGTDRAAPIRWASDALITREGAWFVVRDPDSDSTLKIEGPLLVAPDRGGTLHIDGAEHLGSIELRAAESPGAFDAIELIGIESYLPGVVAAELYPDWTEVAYEVQAVAARSYALHERARRRAAGDPFDLENTTIDQAYAGAKSSPRAREAVAKTRGVVVMFQGAPLRAYYSSACGGRPGSARDTWPTEGEFAFNLAPPLQARERPFACGFSHHFNWTVTRDTATLSKRLAKAGAEAGHPIKAMRRCDAITAIAWNSAGRPTLYEVASAEGEKWKIQADTLRHWCNASAEGLPALTREQTIRSGDIDVIIIGDTVQISGRGFGHGVGMCQFGAEGFARRGWSRDRILRLYYPGASISSAF